MTTISLKMPDELIARMDALAHANRTNRTNRSALLREARAIRPRDTAQSV